MHRMYVMYYPQSGNFHVGKYESTCIRTKTQTLRVAGCDFLPCVTRVKCMCVRTDLSNTLDSIFMCDLGKNGFDEVTRWRFPYDIVSLCRISYFGPSRLFDDTESVIHVQSRTRRSFPVTLELKPELTLVGVAYVRIHVYFLICPELSFLSSFLSFSPAGLMCSILKWTCNEPLLHLAVRNSEWGHFDAASNMSNSSYTVNVANPQHQGNPFQASQTYCSSLCTIRTLTSIQICWYILEIHFRTHSPWKAFGTCLCYALTIPSSASVYELYA